MENDKCYDIEKDLEALSSLQKKTYAYSFAMNSIYLDSVTTAPTDTEEGRSVAMGELSNFMYELTTSDDTINMLKRLSDNKEKLTAHQKREVELLLRDYEYNKSIPQDEFVKYGMLLTKAESVWHKAKPQNDYKAFAPYLKEIMETNARFAKYYKPDNDAYETLIDQYEKGMTVAKCDEFFLKLRESIVPLLKKISQKPQIDDSLLFGDFPVEKQKELTKYIMEYMSADPAHCNCEETEHPFTLEFNKNDVRITTHYYEDNVASSMYSVIHETGHALYELGGSDEHLYTVVAGGVSMGIHESQSRLYENIIGRSKAFAGFILPKLQELFPGKFDNITAYEFYKMINKCEPSLIRIEADELTYPLHVMIRYEIEKKLIHGELSIDELPAEWNRMYKEYLGVDVPDDTHGVLQDSHWSGGSVGYFPSYALGSAYGAQMMKVMENDLDVNATIESGSLKPIANWLGDRIYKKASMYDSMDLLKQVVNDDFDPKYYIEYLENKFSEIYDL